jgi:hypothetical protein
MALAGDHPDHIHGGGIEELLEECACQANIPTPAEIKTPDLSRETTLHPRPQRIQTNLNDTAPTDVMPGTAFEADELYQNAGEKKHAPS